MNEAQELKIPEIKFPDKIFTFYLSHPFDSREYIRKLELEFEERHPKIALLNPFYDVAGEGREDVRARDEGRNFERDAGYNWRLTTRDQVAIAFSRGIVGIVDENSDGSFGTIMEFVYARMLAANPKLLICKHRKKDHSWLATHFHKIYSSFEDFDADVEAQVEKVKKEWGF